MDIRNERRGRNNSEGSGSGILNTGLSLFISREHFFSSKGMFKTLNLLEVL